MLTVSSHPEFHDSPLVDVREQDGFRSSVVLTISDGRPTGNAVKHFYNSPSTLRELADTIYEYLDAVEADEIERERQRVLMTPALGRVA